MATNQKLRQGIYEGILYIELKATEAMDAMAVVELDEDQAGYFEKCMSSGVPFGFCAEQVTDTGVYDYEPGGLVSHTAKVGDYVGVYVCGGILNHKPTAATWGAELYAGTTSAGMCAVTSASSGTKVGICVKAKDTDGICKLKSYL